MSLFGRRRRNKKGIHFPINEKQKKLLKHKIKE